jgi:hypothetical protein
MGKDIVAIFNMFLDPAAAVERIDSKWIWVLPLGLLGIVSACVAWAMGPLTTRIMLRNPPDGVSREQLQQSVAMMEKFSGIGIAITPVIVVIVTLVLAALLLVACKVMDLDTKFSQLFNLVSMASIIKVVGAIAAFAVIKLKGDDIQTMQDLSPSFGLDLFLPDGVNKALFAAVNYFSVFQVWFLIAVAIGLAAFARTSKGKAFIAITPLWLFALLFAVVGAMFRG